MEGLELMPPMVMKRNPVFYDELRRVAGLGGYDDLTPGMLWSQGDHTLVDAVHEDSDLLPHVLAGVRLRRHESARPPGLLDVEPSSKGQDVAPVPWWRRALNRLGLTAH
jgi:hypothetical protein